MHLQVTEQNQQKQTVPNIEKTFSQPKLTSIRCGCSWGSELSIGGGMQAEVGQLWVRDITQGEWLALMLPQVLPV